MRLGAFTVVRAACGAIALARVARGARREAPLTSASGAGDGAGHGADPSVSVVIPARNEQDRLGLCLEALADDPAVTEVVVVDDESTDATAAVAGAHGALVVAAGPRPPAWAGKTWALQRGIGSAKGEWVVALDADTRPARGLVRAAVQAARSSGADLLTVGGRFDCASPTERFLHPAMLATLVYRFGPPGTRRPPRPTRALANGQCMVVPRDSFLVAGGFEPVAGSLVEDVALARRIAGGGGIVKFVDGGPLLDVVGYGSAAAVWHGWGRSLGLAEVTSAPSQAADLILVWAAMAAPLPRLLTGRGDALDVALVSLRIGVLAALAGSYRRRGLTWWLSPLADAAVALGLTATTLRPVRTWRGRTYGPPAKPRGGRRRARPSRSAGR